MSKELITMAASLIIEEESGTYDRTPHAHNGYYAGDFTDQPMLTNTQLAALTALRGKQARHPAWSLTTHPVPAGPRPMGNHGLLDPCRRAILLP